jgi:hypothetical protein
VRNSVRILAVGWSQGAAGDAVVGAVEGGVAAIGGVVAVWVAGAVLAEARQLRRRRGAPTPQRWPTDAGKSAGPLGTSPHAGARVVVAVAMGGKGCSTDAADHRALAPPGS